MTTPILLSWSGGKDAAWALHVLQRDPDIEVVALLTTITEEYQRVSMQGIRIDVARAQAAAAGLPLLEARIPQGADNDHYIASVSAALAQARQRWPGLQTIAFGDLFLADIRAWREALCASLGWTPLFPVFDDSAGTASLARRMQAAGLRAHLCCVDTTQLDARYAGRAFDAALLADLPDGVDPCGERGEFHTCVSAGPMFEGAIDLVRGETVLRDARFAYTDFALA
jgi:uncharacterized protein (TIGR00290 family)